MQFSYFSLANSFVVNSLHLGRKNETRFVIIFYPPLFVLTGNSDWFHLFFFFLVKCGSNGGSAHSYYSGIQADGENTIRNVASYHVKGKENSRGLQLTWLKWHCPTWPQRSPFCRSSLPSLTWMELYSQAGFPLAQKLLQQFQVALLEMIMSRDEKGTGRKWYFFLGIFPRSPH